MKSDLLDQLSILIVTFQDNAASGSSISRRQQQNVRTGLFSAKGACLLFRRSIIKDLSGVLFYRDHFHSRPKSPTSVTGSGCRDTKSIFRHTSHRSLALKRQTVFQIEVAFS